MTPVTAIARVALPVKQEDRTANAVRFQRRRKISREAGRGIEMLGHAIEYLADEFALDCMSGEVRAHLGVHPQIEAIELLMARNREIYLSCPEIPGLGEKLCLWLRRMGTLVPMIRLHR